MRFEVTVLFKSKPRIDFKTIELSKSDLWENRACGNNRIKKIRMSFDEDMSYDQMWCKVIEYFINFEFKSDIKKYFAETGGKNKMYFNRKSLNYTIYFCILKNE